MAPGFASSSEARPTVSSSDFDFRYSIFGLSPPRPPKPRPSPFHTRTYSQCQSLQRKEWGGYHAVCSYGTCHEPEYVALRHSAGLIDVSPLFKYEITGPDAARFLARVTVRDTTRLKVGRMSYLCWCDDDGQVVDDGTVARLGDEHFRLTSAEPALSWLESLRWGFDIELRDSSDLYGALALQGPNAREILRPIVDTDVDALRFFAIVRCRLAGVDIWLSRTGYTGDLGYEIWIPREHAEAVYDAVHRAGEPWGLQATGLDAMDVTRIEAGFIMNGVDYFSAHHCLTEARKASPWELGLGWTVKLDREPFVGQAALRRLKETGEGRRLVGLKADWDEIEAIFEAYGLPPEVPTAAWRDGRPVYAESNRWIGQATSGAWSPILKANLALAQIDRAFSEPGTRVRFEITAEYHRHTVTATVTRTPFFDPPRKKA